MEDKVNIDLLTDQELLDRIYKVFRPQDFGNLEFKDVCAKYDELGFVAVHVSDLKTYKRCRRKWAFQSPFRLHLGLEGRVNPHFWFGSGMHFGYEDYYGHNLYGDPREAYKQYYKAHMPNELPDASDEYADLAYGMFTHWLNLEKQDRLIAKTFMGEPVNVTNWKTVIHEGKPLVEVPFVLRLDELSELAGVPIVVHGTVDRVVEDEEGGWWNLDWKTAKSFDEGKLINDPQVSEYQWAFPQFMDHEIKGMVYVQVRKDYPKPPKPLKNGGFSKAKNQLTTFDMYVDALVEEFGTVPDEYQDILDKLMADEQDGDRYVQLNLVERTEDQKDIWFEQMEMQVKEMLNPYLATYPNPTKDCSWDCDFRALCIMMDAGFDYSTVLESKFVVRTETAKDEMSQWRKRLGYDEKVGEL